MFQKTFIWVVRIVFLFSLAISFYAASQMISAKAEIDRSLQTYNNSTTVEKENPVTDMQIDKDSFPSDRRLNAEVSQTSLPLYTEYPERGEVFGKIDIPSLEQSFPIIHGTDKAELTKGVGHYIGSVFPGEQDNTVLAGHRDTVFRKLGDVQIGDHVYIETTAGKFTYKITHQKIVDKNDRTVIVPYEDATLTLVTCYPFNFIGSAPQRYILTGELTSSTTPFPF